MGSTNNFDTRYNKAMAFLNLMNLHQEKFQSIQNFRDQYLEMKKVCNVLELCFGRCESDTRAMLKKKNVTNPTDTQLNKAMDGIKEELNTIIFMYKVDRQKYGNIHDQMENNVLQKKDPFPKTVSEANTLRAGWKNKPGNNVNNIMKQTTVWHSLPLLIRWVSLYLLLPVYILCGLPSAHPLAFIVPSLFSLRNIRYLSAFFSFFVWHVISTAWHKCLLCM